MRLVVWLPSGGGAALCLATFAGLVWPNSFACGMIPTGCQGFRLRWEDIEALGLFIPPFVAGCLLMIGGGVPKVQERPAQA